MPAKSKTKKRSDKSLIVLAIIIMIGVVAAAGIFWSIKSMNVIFGGNCGKDSPSYQRIQKNLNEFNSIVMVPGQNNQADINNVANGTCSIDVHDDYTIARTFTVNASGGEMTRSITQALQSQGFVETDTTYYKDDCSLLGVSKSFQRKDFVFTVVIRQKLDKCVALQRGESRVSTAEAFESVTVDSVSATY